MLASVLAAALCGEGGCPDDAGGGTPSLIYALLGLAAVLVVLALVYLLVGLLQSRRAARDRH